MDLSMYYFFWEIESLGTIQACNSANSSMPLRTRTRIEVSFFLNDSCRTFWTLGIVATRICGRAHSRCVRFHLRCPKRWSRRRRRVWRSWDAKRWRVDELGEGEVGVGEWRKWKKGNEWGSELTRSECSRRKLRSLALKEMRSPFNEFHCWLGLFPNINKFRICHKHERGNDSVRTEDTVEEREREKLGSRFDLKIWDFFFLCMWRGPWNFTVWIRWLSVGRWVKEPYKQAGCFEDWLWQMQMQWPMNCAFDSVFA